MEITKINGRWTDARGNTANPSASKEEALKQLSSLENCYRCHDCFRCKDCVECEDCVDLRHCKRCRSCYDYNRVDRLTDASLKGCWVDTNYLGDKTRLGKGVIMEGESYISRGTVIEDYVTLGRLSKVFCDIPQGAVIPPRTCVDRCEAMIFEWGSFTLINRRIAVIKADGVFLSFDPFIESSLTQALDRVKLLDYERAAIVSVLESLNPANSAAETV